MKSNYPDKDNLENGIITYRLKRSSIL